MTRLERCAFFVLLVLTLLHDNEATAPFFLQAITSALGTIPFTAGPMTTGLVGAKLAVGSKLLYYLGFFGRRRSKPKPVPVSPSLAKPGFGLPSGAQFPGGMQPIPLPYSFGAGAFPQQFGGLGQPSYYSPYGYDPAQIFQLLAAQGIDPLSTMQAMNVGGSGSQAVPSSQFHFSADAEMNERPEFKDTSGQPVLSPTLNHQEPPVDAPAQSEGDEESDSDVESFFSFLRDMDDNTCISRLVCDIGANPSFLGDFSENIYSIIGQLNVQPTSGAFQYVSIMESGKQGGCSQRFHQCSDAAYEVVKNVAPSVGMPQNINSDTVSQLQK